MDGQQEERLQCFDRSLTDNSTWFGRAAKPFSGSPLFPGLKQQVFPEFADMLREKTVHRDGQMIPVSRWVDQASSYVALVAVFAIPAQSIGTVMIMEWTRINRQGKELDGSGRFEGAYQLYSYRSIPERQIRYFNTIFGLTIALVILQLCAFVARVANALRMRAALFSSVECESHQTVRETVPIMRWEDGLDMFILSGMVAWVVAVYRNKQPASEGGLSALDQLMSDLLSIPWLDRKQSLSVKFDQLFNGVEEMMSWLFYEESLRWIAFLGLFAMLFRAVVYMQCHPRIASLYLTLKNALDDLFHFLIVFMVLILVFAYAAHFMLGTRFAAFETFYLSFYTQFRMLTGDWPFEEEAPRAEYMLYMTLYLVVVFIALLNFLLAVVVNAFTEVQAEMDKCKIELNLLPDVWYSFSYYWHRVRSGWPDRLDIVLVLATIDVDQDDLPDIEEESGDKVPLPVEFLHHLQSLDGRQLFASKESCQAWVEHYLRICPPLSYWYTPPARRMFSFSMDQYRKRRLAWITRDHDLADRMTQDLLKVLKAEAMKRSEKRPTSLVDWIDQKLITGSRSATGTSLQRHISGSSRTLGKAQSSEELSPASGSLRRATTAPPESGTTEKLFEDGHAVGQKVPPPSVGKVPSLGTELYV
jgi:hypothetical protein